MAEEIPVPRRRPPRRDLGVAAEQLSLPERALRDLLRGHRAHLHEAMEMISRDAQALEDVASLLLNRRGDTRESVEIELFTDRQLTRDRLEVLDSLSSEEFVAMRNVFPSAEILEVSLGRDLKMIENGIVVRMLVSQQALQSRGARRYLQTLAEAGAEVRATASVPLHMNIHDRAIVVVGAGPGSQGEGADVILHNSLVANCFFKVFIHGWELAQPYGELNSGSRGKGIQLSPQQYEVLALLATGVKDETIARRLACSDRTLRRLMNQLMDKLGASSRFEAGVIAARLGLVN